MRGNPAGPPGRGQAPPFTGRFFECCRGGGWVGWGGDACVALGCGAYRVRNRTRGRLRRPGVRGVSGQEQDEGDACVALGCGAYRVRNRTRATLASPPRSTQPPPLRNGTAFLKKPTSERPPGRGLSPPWQKLATFAPLGACPRPGNAALT
jgi:hypothetical protein